MKFTKMQGLGNDYVYVYGLGNSVEDPGALARRLSDRHFGVGADGLILIDPSSVADFRMRMFNADGSRSAMCGNGIRCVGKYVYDKGYTDKREIEVETDAGVKQLSLFLQDGKVSRVKVDMGRPELESRLIPVNSEKERIVNFPFSAGGKEYSITCVSMGNPHGVVFVEKADRIDVNKIGPLFEYHPFFPQRTNVEFVEVISPEILKMRVWERGSGETLACGTGACASLVAGVLNGKCKPAAEVRLLGGSLQIEWAVDGHVYMTGGAETVYEGEMG